MAKVSNHGEYGFDGSLAGAIAMLAAGVLLAAATVLLVLSEHVRYAVFAATFAAVIWSTLAIYLHTTRRGKFLVWAELLDSLRVRGDEQVLDVGCGRGAVLTMVARRLHRGSAVGIDLWSVTDQSGNGPAATEQNLIAEGVRDRCELVTGDMRSMPFPDASFDLIVSSIAIHNISSRSGRIQAIDEIARVLAPGGQVAIADLAWTWDYAQRLEALGFIGVTRRPLGWRFWWGPALPATTLVRGMKPGGANHQRVALA